MNDKRRYIRYEVLDCARVEISGHEPFQSIVVNIGLGGLQLRARNGADQGAACVVTVGRAESEPLDLPCEVRHCVPVNGSGLHSLGLKFVPRSHNERIAIAEFVHSVFQRQCDLLSN